MIRSELIARLQAQNPQLYLRDCEGVVDAIFETMTAALARGDRVELRGFCTLTVNQRAARAGRNPRTGEPVSVEAKRTVVFKTGREMRQRLNPRDPETPEEIVARILERG